MNNYTTDELLTSLKRRGLIPSTTETLAASDFIDIANEELQTYIVPAVVSTRQEYYVVNSDVTITSATNKYAIPYRAIGGKLRDIFLVQSDGSVIQLEHYEEERSPDGLTGSGDPYAFRIEGNYVVLYPTPSSSRTLRFRYLQRPAKLAATSNASMGKLTAVNASTYQLTFSVSYGEPSFSTASTYDIISGTPNFTTLAADQIATGWSRAAGPPVVWTLTAATYPTGVAIGDWVSTPDLSPVVQCPVEFFPLLAQRTAGKVLEATGFRQEAATAFGVADQMMKTAVNLIQNRDEAQAPVIMNPYGPGFGRGGRGAWRRS